MRLSHIHGCEVFMHKNFFVHAKERLSEEKAVCVILAAYAVFQIFSCIWFAAHAEARNAALSFVYLLAIPAALLIEWLIDIRFPALFHLFLFLLAAGGILGSCYDVYTVIPAFDEVLHGISGILFCAVGFTLFKRILGEDESKKSFLACLLAGILFSLAIAVLWELFEYACYVLVGADMQEDMIIDGFGSYLLSGSHNETVVIDGITQTIIHYGDGKTYVIEGGYLDIGLYDTLNDMLVCTVGCLLFAAALIPDRKLGGKLKKLLIGRISPSNKEKTE